jgi:hypothetical protein
VCPTGRACRTRTWKRSVCSRSAATKPWQACGAATRSSLPATSINWGPEISICAPSNNAPPDTSRPTGALRAAYQTTDRVGRWVISSTTSLALAARQCCPTAGVACWCSQRTGATAECSNTATADRIEDSSATAVGSSRHLHGNGPRSGSATAKSTPSGRDGGQAARHGSRSCRRIVGVGAQPDYTGQ